MGAIVEFVDPKFMANLPGGRVSRLAVCGLLVVGGLARTGEFTGPWAWTIGGACAVAFIAGWVQVLAGKAVRARQEQERATRVIEPAGSGRSRPGRRKRRR
jgi:hypothetical protein